MEKIPSKDGTPIAYQRSGDGPPLILVHGTGSASTRWKAITPAFEHDFSVYAVDRRGRGESGDAATYALGREFEDIATIADSFSEPVYLLGHSYGGLCSLEATLLTHNIAKLILYEPPIPVHGFPIYRDNIIERLTALLDQGQREEVLATFMREVVRMPPRDFELSRSLPTWSGRVAAAYTLPREMRAQQNYQFDPARFKNLHVPNLLMLGSDSPDFFKAAIETLHDVLPNNRVVVLPGQQHIAMDTAPKLFAHEVIGFLKE